MIAQRPASIPVLSLWQPWASLCFIEDHNARKWHETRGYAPPAARIGQRFAIHATATRAPARFISPALFQRVELWWGWNWESLLPHGRLIGSVLLSAAHPLRLGAGDHIARTSADLDAGDWSPGRWAWRLDDPRRLDVPIPARGKQGWWRSNEPELLAHLPVIEPEETLL